MRIARLRDVSLGVAWRGIHNYLHDPALLVPSMIFPLFFLAAFAGGLSTINRAPGFHYSSGYLAFQFVYVVFQAVIYGGVFTGVTIALDIQGGLVRRFMLAAPDRAGVIVGYVIFGLVRGLVPAAMVTAVALLCGMRIDGAGVDLVGLVSLLLLANVAASLWALGLAMRIRSAQAGPLLQITMFLVLFLAPVYVPLELISGWVHDAASVNPITALLEAGRGFVSGGEASVGLAFAAAAVLGVLFAAWAWRGVKHVERAP
jgi:ABC-2 type transport system permease protein